MQSKTNNSESPLLSAAHVASVVPGFAAQRSAFRDDALERAFAAGAGARRTLTAMTLRLAIGVAWLAAAAWLYTVSTHPQASSMGQVLALAGVAASVAAALMAGVSVARLRGARKRVISRAETIGLELRDEAFAVSDALDLDMRAMGAARAQKNAQSAATRLTSSTAAAEAFYQNVEAYFDPTLIADAPVGGVSKRGAKLALAVAAIAEAALIGVLILSPTARNAVFGGGAFAAFPVSALILLGLGVIYAAAGLIVDAFGGRADPSAPDRSTAALAMRAALSGDTSIDTPSEDQPSAPPPSVMAAKVDEARRLIDGEFGNDSADQWRAPIQSTIDGSAQDGEPPRWRRPAEGPRFVETGFSAAPKVWRTDAFAARDGKNHTGEPETKQRFFPRGNFVRR